MGDNQRRASNAGLHRPKRRSPERNFAKCVLGPYSTTWQVGIIRAPTQKWPFASYRPLASRQPPRRQTPSRLKSASHQIISTPGLAAHAPYQLHQARSFSIPAHPILPPGATAGLSSGTSKIYPCGMNSDKRTHRKRVRHDHDPGHCHELTFACFHRRPLPTNNR
jgi:hypothetical protein